MCTCAVPPPSPFWHSPCHLICRLWQAPCILSKRCLEGWLGMPGDQSSTPETFRTARFSFQPIPAGLGHVPAQHTPGRGTLSSHIFMNLLIRLGARKRMEAGMGAGRQLSNTTKISRCNDNQKGHTIQGLSCANTPDIGCAVDRRG